MKHVPYRNALSARGARAACNFTRGSAISARRRWLFTVSSSLQKFRSKA
jgi:hypothetical protein